MSSPPTAGEASSGTEPPISHPENTDIDGSGEREEGQERSAGDAPDSETRWSADLSSALRRISHSLGESTAPCNEVVISSGGDKVCGNCQAGYASYDTTRGVWKVWYRPLPQSLIPSLPPCSPGQACSAESGIREVAELKPGNASGAETEEDPLSPPVEMVKSVLKQMEIRDIIGASCSAKETDGNDDIKEVYTAHLRQGEAISLAPLLKSVCPSGIRFDPLLLCQYLKPEGLSNIKKWEVLFLDQQNEDVVADANIDLSSLRAFIMDCLVSDNETSSSTDNTEDNAASIVSVETPHQHPSRQSDGFASVSSLGDVSSHTADTNIGTDEDSRLTDDAPKDPLLGCLDAVDNQPPKKKRKYTRKEVDILQKDEGRVAAPDRKIVQLFASDFEPSSEDVKSQGRPKRKIKHVVRFDAVPHSYSLERKKMAAAGKTGSGFLCPSCSFHCSYDVRMCLKCGLSCRYVAGTGVVVERERDEVAKDPPPDIKGDMNFFELKTSSKKSAVTAAEHVEEKEAKGKEKAASSASIKTNGSKPVASPAVQAAPKIPVPSPSTNRNVKKGNGIDSFECGYCEVCFQIFPSSYLQTHRKRAHGLSSNLFGCPYCPQHLSSDHNREIHIQKKHPGKISNLSDEELASTKIRRYLCPKCMGPPFTLLGLRNHLRCHGVYRTADVQHLIRCVCPFCPPGDNKEPVTFETDELLEGHMKEQHEGCNLMGSRLKTNVSAAQKNVIKEPSRKKVKEPKMVDKAAVPDPSEDDSTSTNVGEEDWWTPLSHHFAVSQVRDLDKDLCSGSISLDSAAMTIAKRLGKAQRQINRSRMSEEDGRKERDFVEEGRLFLRGVRDRQGMADKERLEKEKYKAQVEEKLMRWRYENRGRPKKTAAEKEEHALLSRPIYFEQRKNQRCAENNECCVGADCPLCSGEYAKWIITDDEMKKANFDVLKAIPLPLHEKSKKIMSPSFHELPRDHEHETDDEESVVANDQGGQQKATATEKKLTRSAERWKNASEEAQRLSEAKNSLEFIRQYNEGLLEPAARPKRGVYY